MESAAKQKVLLVEDNENLRRIFEIWLVANGWNVVSAGSAEQAMSQAAQEGPVDLLLTDIGLPDGNGWDLAQFLLPLHDIPRVLYASAVDLHIHHQEGRLIPAELFLSKPIGRQEYLDRVGAILKS